MDKEEVGNEGGAKDSEHSAVESEAKRNEKAAAASEAKHHEARWPAVIAVLAVAALYEAVPAVISIGPRWLVSEIVLLLLILIGALPYKKYPNLNVAIGIAINVVLTVAIVGSLVLLVQSLPTHKETPFRLLGSAGALWFSNILVFALWYWRLDAGGPRIRELFDSHRDGAFLFPQMAMHPQSRVEAGEASWTPNFVDYLFVAFNTSTALSPTDTAVLSRWAKVLMMMQSLISLSIIALLAARVVNIL